jgi:hypothetical protein
VIVDGVAACVPQVRECADTDGNPCTDICDFATDQCSPTVPKCIPDCERCNPATGTCEPVNVGGACDDGDICTPQTRCEHDDTSGRTYCLFGVPIGPSLTPTAMAATPTPAGSPRECVGDCDGNGAVIVNEVISGVTIALGRRSVGQCSAFDADASASVEVYEIIAAVRASLAGCPR